MIVSYYKTLSFKFSQLYPLSCIGIEDLEKITFEKNNTPYILKTYNQFNKV